MKSSEETLCEELKLSCVDVGDADNERIRNLATLLIRPMTGQV